MNNPFFKASKKATITKVPAPKLQGVKTIGYINLVATKQGKRIKYHATVTVKRAKAKVLTFRSKKALQGYQLLNKVGNTLKGFLNATIQAAREVYSQFQTNVQKAQNMLKLASLRHYDTVQRFPLMVAFYKAVNEAKEFKYSLPKTIRLNLF